MTPAALFSKKSVFKIKPKREGEGSFRVRSDQCSGPGGVLFASSATAAVKASGAQLAMVWRCEQGWERINGWHDFGFEELIRVEITPAPQ